MNKKTIALVCVTLFLASCGNTKKSSVKPVENTDQIAISSSQSCSSSDAISSSEETASSSSKQSSSSATASSTSSKASNGQIEGPIILI